MLTSREVPARELARLRVLAGLLLANAVTLPDPDSTGSQHAAQLTGAGQITPVARAQAEVFVVMRQRPGRLTVATREAVVRVGPGGRLLRVVTGQGDVLGQLRELVPAALTDGRERN